MKQFLIELPEKKYDKTGMLKNYLINEIAKKYPYLTMDGIDGPKNEHTSMQYAGPGDYIAFGISPKYNVSALRPSSWTNPYADTPCYTCPFNSVYKYEKYNMLSQFDIAMKKLDEYAKSTNCQLDKGYDFKWFGLPVRIYQNFIQIGNTYVPKCGNMYILPDDLSEKQKETINNVIININIITSVNIAA